MDRVEELRVLYQGRRLTDARALYEREPGGTDPECYFIGSLIYWHLGEYPLSRWAAEYGLALKPQGEIRIKLLQRLGSTEEALGAYGEAVEHLEACLAGLPAYHSLGAILKGPVLNNLALAHYHRNSDSESLRRAIDYYQQAAAEFRQEGMREHLCICLHSLAWVLCDTGQADRAADVIDEAAPLCTNEQTRHHQVVVNAYQLLVAGDCVRSLAMLEPLLRAEEGSPAFIYALSVTALASLSLRDRDPGALSNASTIAKQAMFAACKPGADPRGWTIAKRVQERVINAMKEQSRGA